MISGIDHHSLGPRAPGGLRRLIHPLGPLFRRLPLVTRRHLLYIRHARRIGNFKTPQSYTEKMQWRILNDRRPLIEWTSDKLAQLEYVLRLKAQNPLLVSLRLPKIYWVGTDLRELEPLSRQLPSRFVIKPNHSSGRYLSVDQSKDPLDWDRTIEVANQWIAPDEEELVYGHWPYGKARHLLVAQERIGQNIVPESEMRGWVFDGTLQQITRFEPSRRAAANYDRKFVRVDSSRVIDMPVDEPNHFDQISTEKKELLVHLMELIAAPFDHMRVDIFVDGDEFWFNELSPFAFSGLAHYPNYRFDLERGSYWTLPQLGDSGQSEAEWRQLTGSEPLGTIQRETSLKNTNLDSRSQTGLPNA